MTSLTPPPHPTAKPKPCHNRERDTAISQTSSVHITRGRWVCGGGGGGGAGGTEPLQSITAHCTALSSHQWHLGERGCLGEEGRLLGALLNSGRRLVSWWRKATAARGVIYANLAKSHSADQNKTVDIKTRQWGHVTG